MRGKPLEGLIHASKLHKKGLLIYPPTSEVWKVPVVIKKEKSLCQFD